MRLHVQLQFAFYLYFSLIWPINHTELFFIPHGVLVSVPLTLESSCTFFGYHSIFSHQVQHVWLFPPGFNSFLLSGRTRKRVKASDAESGVTNRLPKSVRGTLRRRLSLPASASKWETDLEFLWRIVNKMASVCMKDSGDCRPNIQHRLTGGDD